ncbi:MAG: hypothetical protein IPF54_13690 [Draconibacterium sp.]|nr:hypothetical protein [Draconibacterium sp.]
MGNSTICSQIIYSRIPEQELLKWIEKYTTGKVFLATEDTVNEIWISKFDDFLGSKGIKKVVIPAGENNKKIESVAKNLGISF